MSQVSPVGLRLRTTALTALVLAVALGVGGAVLATVFASNRVASIDARLAQESGQLVALVGSAQLPAPLPAGPGVDAQVLDADGEVLAASAGISRVLPLLPGRYGRTQLLTTDGSTASDQRLRVSLTAVPGGGTVLVALPLTDVDEATRALRRSLLLVVPGTVVAGAAATWVAVGSALRPVERLRSAADGVLDVRTPAAPQLPVTATGDEIERLARTLNAMLGRLHASDERQRAFVADAAHELRSPLAAALVQLEVALTSPDVVTELVQGALLDVQRLRSLVEDLLLLARLDAGEPRVATAVDLAAYAEHSPGPVLVDADPAALEHAVRNLVSNARRHARSTVRVSAAVHGQSAVLSVEDDGDGIAAADRERVFERWTRLDDARSRDAGGAGLGLAIARSVAEAAGGRLTVDASPLGGARFELRLPLRGQGGHRSRTGGPSGRQHRGQ